MKLTLKIAAVMVFTFALSCGKSQNPLPEEEQVKIEDPEAVTLIFPENNVECQEGTVISDTQSKVLFQWDASVNTDSYEVRLENLESNTSSVFSSNTNELEVVIDRATTYRWSVLSMSTTSENTAESDVWQFYNAGAGIINHTPFPADIVRPQLGTSHSNSSQIILEWLGNDIDNDIINYEVFFGTENPPTKSLATVTNTNIEASVISGNTYYWFIKTTDGATNTSKSDIFWFEVK